MAVRPMQLVEAHLIPGSTLRAADLKPGALYQTALAGAFLTVSSVHVSPFMSQYSPYRPCGVFALALGTHHRSSGTQLACMWHLPCFVQAHHC